MKFWSWVLLLVVLVGFVPGLTVSAAPLPQTNPQDQARLLLSEMSPEQKVGQLFLVTFKGKQIDKSSPIYKLILNNYIGGVMLKAGNDNFTGPVDTIKEISNLNNSLQSLAWEAAVVGPNDPVASIGNPSPYIPLFISVSQSGDGAPNDQILTGLTPLPSQMSIGATWNSVYAEEVGSVLGEELASIGVNLLIGPSLDIINSEQSQNWNDLGVRSFGSNPFWVGVMGRSYIRGIHTGSDGKVGVIANHFPGRGSADRSAEEEIATVREPLDQLRQKDLAPFFSVTRGGSDPQGMTDGLYLSHVRYQGLQGNIRPTTRPISFDAAAFDVLMQLPPLADWRSQGGVVVSDDLGSNAIRQFYDPTGLTFDARQVARSAFLAGSDLLYVDNFTATGDPDSYTTLLRTLEFFAQKYREDPAFAQRVNASVERLLTLKYKIYPTFDISQVAPDSVTLQVVGVSQETTFDVARESATLLSPSAVDLDVTLPRPPANRERIVFITDTLSARQCSTCTEQVVFAPDAFQNAVVRLYGPRAGEQVAQYQLTSYTFADLNNMLSGLPDLPPIEADVRSADWIVFSSLDVRLDQPQTNALKRFLDERPDLITNKRVVVFAFGAPYYLDATDISKLSAYYGLYGKSTPFVEVAARLLFQELTPLGAPPVSIAGIGYDLSNAVKPDPGQVISLFLDTPALTMPTVAPENLPTPQPPTFRVGDTLPLRTGIIYDHNRKPVPDGTVVRFYYSSGGDGAVAQQVETTTSAGVARSAYRIQNTGLLEIRVVSEQAVISEILRLDISSTEGAAITAIAPTQALTTVTAVTETPTPSPTPSPTPVPIPSSASTTGTWLLSVILVWFGAVGIYAAAQNQIAPRWGVRWALLTVCGGMLAYILMELGVLVSPEWLQRKSITGVIGILLLGMLLGWGVGFVWRRRFLQVNSRAQQSRPSQNDSSSDRKPNG